MLEPADLSRIDRRANFAGGRGRQTIFQEELNFCCPRRVNFVHHAARLPQFMKTAKSKDSATSRWLSYRPEIKVLDCTIRDGGLMNNHHFEDKIVKVVYDTCVAAGIDYMELGY